MKAGDILKCVISFEKADCEIRNLVASCGTAGLPLLLSTRNRLIKLFEVEQLYLVCGMNRTYTISYLDGLLLDR